LPIPNKPTGLVAPLLRGDVYQVNLDPTVGGGMKKSRPALVIQNDIGNKYSPVTIIAPITSAKETTRPLPIMVYIGEGEGGLKSDGYVHCGQIRTVDRDLRLVHKWGHLSPKRMNEIDKALRISLALP
jgi:mRNA interferase MazF